MKICASDIRFRQFLQRFQLPLYCTNWFKFIMNWQICVGRRWTSAQSHARLRKFQRGFQRKAIFVCACFCENSKCLNLCRLIKIDQGLTNLRRVMLEICATRYSSAIVFCEEFRCSFLCKFINIDHGLTNLRRAMFVCTILYEDVRCPILLKNLKIDNYLALLCKAILKICAMR